MIWYIYDGGSDVLGFIYNGTPYYYLKNQQGDVMQIVDENMNVVGSYTYDAWGKVLSATGSMAQINPIRYRSYYYDKETSLYYLQSRYYDPEVGRFINADDTGYLGAGNTVLSYNLFSYCDNNPVNKTDENGFVATRVIISAAIGGVVGALLEVVLQIIQGQSIRNLDWWRIGIEFFNGALTGGLIGFGLNPGYTTFGRALINMVTSLAHSIHAKANFWVAIGAALFSGLATYAFGLGQFCRGKSIITRTMVQSVVNSVKSRFSRFTIRVLWWKFTVSI